MHGTRDEHVALPPPFEVVLRGFDRQQVIDHINALKAHVVAVGAERDAALARATGLHERCEQLRREAAQARQSAEETATEVDRLQRSPLSAATARIQRMLQIAEDEAAELAATAEQETTSLRERAHAEADRLLAETRQRCERLEAESTSRRQAEQAQSERDIARREAETHTWVRDYQARSVAALHLIMYLAGERLSSRMVTAKRQVSAARALRSEVTGQLSEVHRLLAEALGVVDAPAPAEQAEYAEPAQGSPLREDQPTARFGPHS